MKVRVILNNIKVDISDDLAKAQDYFKRHGLPIEWEITQKNITDLQVERQNFGSAGFRYVLKNPHKNLVLNKDNITIFAFNGREFDNVPTSTCTIYPTGVLIALMTYKEGDVIGETYSHLLHEMMHALNQQLRFSGVYLQDPMDSFFENGKWYFYHNNDKPDLDDSNFGRAWKLITPHLDKLTEKKGYKYFADWEIKGLKPELVEMLDKARGLAGIPFVINSGYRTKEHNAEVGGVENSSHTKGLAVDLRARNSTEHYLITKSLLEVGFKRISRIYPSHVHCDIDETKPQNVLF